MSTPPPPALQLVETEDKTRLVYCVNKYNLPQGYLSWKRTLDYLRPSIKAAITKLDDQGEDWFSDNFYWFSNNGYARCGFLAGKTLLADVPPTCISEQILESFLKTDVPSMETPNYSLPAFIFQLPIKIGKTIASDYDLYSMLIVPVDNSNTLDIVCITQKKHLLLEMSCNWSCNLRDKESIGFGHELGDATKQDLPHINFPEERIAPKDIDQDLLNTINKVERIAKNAVLAYTYEKKYVKDADERETTFSKGFKDNDDKPMPFRWLGKDFTQSVSKSTAKILDSSNSNQRSKVRPHWRRGHWHTVCSGTKHKERQVRWFKPVFVNGD
jgi:hypothetical protein